MLRNLNEAYAGVIITGSGTCPRDFYGWFN